MKRDATPYMSNMYAVGTAEADNAHPSGKAPQAEPDELTEMAQVFMEHGVSEAEALSATDRLATLRAAWSAGEITEDQMDAMAEVILMNLFARARLARAS